MTVSLNIKRNSRELQKLKQRLRYLDGVTADVGFFADKVYPANDGDRGGVPVATIAHSNNDGITIIGKAVIPSRPFFDYAVREARSGWHKAAAEVFRASCEGGGTWRVSLTAYLIKYQQTIQRHILEMSSPANAALTIKLKGFDDPLIRTGFMHDSVDYRINKRGRK